MDALCSTEIESGMDSDTVEIRERALEIIRELSFAHGNVKLSSGQDSDFYFNMKPAMMDPEGANLLTELILERLADIDVDRIGGLEMGAVPLISPIASASHLTERPLPGFFIRKEVKEHGTMQRIEGNDLDGKKVAILDDVTTSGKSAMTAVEFVRKAGGEVVIVLSIVDRGEGAAELYSNENIAFGSIFKANEFLDS